VHPLHRLDKGTSGVLLFALDADSAREVGGQFQRDEVRKRYLAIVRGWPADAGLIDHPLSRRFDDYGRRLHARGHEPERYPPHRVPAAGHCRTAR
jgi:tRNA pseudouridine65 synthase